MQDAKQNNGVARECKKNPIAFRFLNNNRRTGADEIPREREPRPRWPDAEKLRMTRS
jgi:hypothetical protein